MPASCWRPLSSACCPRARTCPTPSCSCSSDTSASICSSTRSPRTSTSARRRTRAQFWNQRPRTSRSWASAYTRCSTAWPIAAGFMVAPTLGLLLFLAVLLHKVPEGFTVASITLVSGRSRAAALLAGMALRVLTMLGAVATTLLAGRHVGYALALSAGVTIYVAASDLIPEVNREGGPALGWTVFGGLLLFVLADWLLSPLGATGSR
ncbi:MAG TPA: ZIP family metal transporter [Candidatus Binatus sp.]|nr:ZIP family metal transporter [Candidatus Binatus sp.]